MVEIVWEVFMKRFCSEKNGAENSDNDYKKEIWRRIYYW
jgi:hypothetical protein